MFALLCTGNRNIFGLKSRVKISPAISRIARKTLGRLLRNSPQLKSNWNFQKKIKKNIKFHHFNDYNSVKSEVNKETQSPGPAARGSRQNLGEDINKLIKTRTISLWIFFFIFQQISVKLIKTAMNDRIKRCQQQDQEPKISLEVRFNCYFVQILIPPTLKGEKLVA